MKIDFFEEYCDDRNLAAARMFGREAADRTIFLAAHDLTDFIEKKNILARYSNAEAAYWPVLEKSYWISLFSYPEELEKLAAEMKSESFPAKVLFDLELPILKKSLFYKNALQIIKNCRLIAKLYQIAEANRIEIYSAEYPSPGICSTALLRMFRLSPGPRRSHTAIPMFYTSMIRSPRWQKRILKEIRRRSRKQKMAVGLGTLATGVLGTEPILSPEKLQRDIDSVKEIGIDHVVIFRLGGLGANHKKVV